MYRVSKKMVRKRRRFSSNQGIQKYLSFESRFRSGLKKYLDRFRQPPSSELVDTIRKNAHEKLPHKPSSDNASES